IFSDPAAVIDFRKEGEAAISDILANIRLEIVEAAGLGDDTVDSGDANSRSQSCHHIVETPVAKIADSLSCELDFLFHGSQILRAPRWIPKNINSGSASPRYRS